MPFVSLGDKVSVVLAPLVYTAQALMVIVPVGAVVSKIVVMVFDTVLGFDAPSVATPAAIYQVTIH